GARIDTFEAEIVGVLKGGRTEGDVILARATAGPALQSGIALGMSGSPVTVDGRLIGAVSGLWPFSREPIFGITPIGEMLRVLDHPDSPSRDETAGPEGAEVGSSTGIHFGEFGWEPAGAPAAETPPPTPSSDP